MDIVNAIRYNTTKVLYPSQALFIFDDWKKLLIVKIECSIIIIPLFYNKVNTFQSPYQEKTTYKNSCICSHIYSRICSCLERKTKRIVRGKKIKFAKSENTFCKTPHYSCLLSLTPNVTAILRFSTDFTLKNSFLPLFSLVFSAKLFITPFL